jgi:hypothetical protein
MAPCTYVRLTLGAAPGSCIRFESLEFTDIDGPAPVDGLLPGQAIRSLERLEVVNRPVKI